MIPIFPSFLVQSKPRKDALSFTWSEWKVSSPGHTALTTQHKPHCGSPDAPFELLVPRQQKAPHITSRPPAERVKWKKCPKMLSGFLSPSYALFHSRQTVNYRKDNPQRGYCHLYQAMHMQENIIQISPFLSFIPLHSVIEQTQEKER